MIFILLAQYAFVTLAQLCRHLCSICDNFSKERRLSMHGGLSTINTIKIDDNRFQYLS